MRSKAKLSHTFGYGRRRSRVSSLTKSRRGQLEPHSTTATVPYVGVPVPTSLHDPDLYLAAAGYWNHDIFEWHCFTNEVIDSPLRRGSP